MTNIIETVINEEKSSYKCYDLLKNLLYNNEEFRNIVISGMKEGKVYGFPNEFWEMIKNQNIRGISSFDDVFKDGANIGYCTVAAKQLSYSFDNCFICGGVLPILAGTENCPDGSHTWIVYNQSVIDTSLMLVIDEQYSKKLGYIEENRYDPNVDPIYVATKDWTNDTGIKKANT